MNAETAGHVGIQKLKRLVMESIKKFLREYTDQAISFGTASTDDAGVRPGPGLKLPGPRPISNANKGLIHRQQASSSKHQASSRKRLEAVE